MTAARPLQRLVRIALGGPPEHALEQLVAFVADAAGAAETVLWDQSAEPTGVPVVVARWPASGSEPAEATAVVTSEVLRSGSLVLGEDHGEELVGLPVALPAGLGALTLRGPGVTAEPSFEVVADLLDVLPDLCHTLAQRRALALLEHCETLLAGDASDALAAAGRAVARAWDCAEVTLDADPATGAGLGAAADGATLALPLRTGEHVLGTMVCRRDAHLFGRSEVATLAHVADQLARRLCDRQARRAVAAEVASWRALALSLTEFSTRLSDELESRDHRDDRVYSAAVDVVRSVVPTFLAGQVRPARAHRAGPQRPVVDRRRLARLGHGPEVGWLVQTPIGVGDTAYGVLEAVGAGPEVPEISAQVCRIVGDHLGLYQHLRGTLDHLRDTRRDLEDTVRRQAEAMEDLEHQLVSPLLAATSRIEQILDTGRIESRTVAHLRAVRGLCRKAGRVAMAAGVFAALSNGRPPVPRLDHLGADDLLRLLIAAADDAQHLSNPRRGTRFTVERDTVRELGRRLVRVDRSFLEQCVGNLLDNAAKYSYQDTVVEIRGGLVDDGFSIFVASTGLVLSDHDARRCVERNWRSDQARVSTGEGSGLGLWIADQLMGSMGGSVAVVPRGELTTVHLRFPLR